MHAEHLRQIRSISESKNTSPKLNLLLFNNRTELLGNNHNRANRIKVSSLLYELVQKTMGCFSR